MADEREQITELLKEAKVIAVVGLSGRASRTSHWIAKYLQEAGYRIIPVNPKETEVLGERAVGRLEDVKEKVDIVNVFRRSEFVPEVVDGAIAIGARAIWMQEGVVHRESAKRAEAAGIFVVMDRCIYKDHRERVR